MHEVNRLAELYCEDEDKERHEAMMLAATRHCLYADRLTQTGQPLRAKVEVNKAARLFVQMVIDLMNELDEVEADETEWGMEYHYGIDVNELLDS